MLKHLTQWLQKPTHPVAHKAEKPVLQAYLHQPGQPVWSERRYQPFAQEGYQKNVIAHRAIAMIASSAANIRFKLFDHGSSDGMAQELTAHPLLTLLAQPQTGSSRADLVEGVISHRLISGNAYLLAIGPDEEAPQELHLLRPDRMSVLSGKNGYPAAYRHSLGSQHQDYPIHPLSGHSRVLHLRAFNPLNDYYGLSPMEAAAYSIDMHNQANSWNQALMQNAARPSGALIVKGQGDAPGRLSEDQYYRIKQQVDDQFSGAANAGRPLLLEGGLEWKEMSLSPREMDYLNAKHSAARDIALAFGVPPQLLGIPGDNTYSNLAEARLALWEQTILPLMEQFTEGLNGWLTHYYPGQLELKLNLEGISAHTLRQEKLWDRVEKASFLSDEEKRKMVGLGE
jgi:HK97 family phage portal protein